MQLYLWDGTRRIIIERHSFFVEQAKQRLLNQFTDIEGEADRYEEKAWEAAQSIPCYDGEIDMGDLAESVRDDAISHYVLLDEMRKQVLLSMIAGLFHQWDKELREFIDMEFMHYTTSEWIEKHIWRATTAQIFEILEEFDWKVTEQPFYKLIDACNLIVNVYKHGKGASLKRLHDNYPKYLTREGWESWTGKVYLDHRWLNVSHEDFDKFADAIKSFWRGMPEQLYVNIKNDDEGSAA